jgi:uncharacterized protein
MSIHTKYEPGTFSWVELTTTDGGAAKAFYAALFGWTFEDNQVGPDMVYSMGKLGDQYSCGLFTMKAMEGIPPHWLSYITVDDADAAAKKASANGGKVMREPFDVMTAGRMAVLTDPTGALFAVWQPKEHIGAGVKQAPGSLTWNELFTTDIAAAGPFYAKTFGWTTKAIDMGPMGTYTLFGPAGAEPGESNVGGMMGLPPNMKGVPPHWLAYFAVADCDASTT